MNVAAMAAKLSGDVERRSSAFSDTVRRLRQERRLTLRELAARSGLASSTISKVENGLMSPTYDNILRLATGLGVDLEALFHGESRQVSRGHRSLTRAGEGRKLAMTGYSFEMLCTDLAHKKFTPILATLPAGSTRGVPELVRHAGDEFVFVVEGRITILTDTYEPLPMERGDSCYFDSSMGHALVATADVPATVLWVASEAGAPDIAPSRS